MPCGCDSRQTNKVVSGKDHDARTTVSCTKDLKKENICKKETRIIYDLELHCDIDEESHIEL